MELLQSGNVTRNCVGEYCGREIGELILILFPIRADPRRPPRRFVAKLKASMGREGPKNVDDLVKVLAMLLAHSSGAK